MTGPTIAVRVIDKGGTHGPIGNAEVRLSSKTPQTKTYTEIERALTDYDGRVRFSQVAEDGEEYRIECDAFGIKPVPVPVGAAEVLLQLPLSFEITTHKVEGEKVVPWTRGQVGRPILARAESSVDTQKGIKEYEWKTSVGAIHHKLPGNEVEITFTQPGLQRIEVRGLARMTSGDSIPVVSTYREIHVSEPDVQTIAGKVGVSLERTAIHHTLDEALWMAIRNRTRAISFHPYREFMDRVLGIEERESLGVPTLDRKLNDLGTHMHGVNAYELLRIATETFLLLQCGVRIEEGSGRERLFDVDDEAGRYGGHITLELAKAKLKEYLGSPPQLPYITRVIDTAFPYLERDGVGHDRVLAARVNEPCLIELIWSYWMEEGMLVQTMNAISRRFQNMRSPEVRDPLAHLEIDPLRPVGNIIWGYIQGEINRLTVRRRAYEYSHHYGLMLYGKATASMLPPADNRSKFVEALNNLIHQCLEFFKQDYNTTVIADGYPLLNALKEVHLVLAQGAHNQFGDLPWAARAEMMLEQWILSRPEIRDFLQSRAMVPYKEPWMPIVDTMKTLQGWSDVTVTHFRDLAVYGEQMLLSIRYGDWINFTSEDHAKTWARYWRPEIQAYVHAYRAVTGVDLTSADAVDATMPGILLQKRLATQQGAR